MPSQYAALLFPPRTFPSSLTDGLRRCLPLAEWQLAEHHNRLAPSGTPPIPLPTGTAYDSYDTAHLVLLWQSVRNLAALQVVAEREGLTLPAVSGPVERRTELEPFYGQFPHKLLRRLWDVGHDAPAFVEMLRRGVFWAEQQLVVLYNDTLGPTPPLSCPTSQEYERYDAVLLGLLWVLADNEPALHVLAEREGETLTTPPDYARMSSRFRRCLWALARDGLALAQEWRGEDGLEVRIPATPATPEKVLGWKILFQDGEESDTQAAWDHLARRYALLVDGSRAGRGYSEHDDRRQERAADLVKQLPHWDLLNHDRLAGWLRRVQQNRAIDHARRSRHGVQPAAGGPERQGEQVLDPSSQRATHAADAREEIGRRANWQDEALHRALAHLDWPVELRDQVVRENLRCRGIPEPTREQITAEEDRIRTWLSTHRDRTNSNLAKLLLFHRPVLTSQKKTLSRLRVLFAQCQEALRGLKHRLTQADQRAGAVRLLNGLQRFIDRAAGKKRRGDWPVLLFATTVNDARTFLSSLAGGMVENTENITALFRCLRALEAFWKRFPVLAKLARVRDLCGLADDGPEVHDLLLRIRAWVDGGENWLITFGKRDNKTEKARCQAFAAELEPLTARPGAGQSARRLLLLWLRAIQRPGPAQPRLLDLDRAWTLARNTGADEMLGHAVADNWPAVAELAARMQSSPAALESSWWDRLQLRAHLTRLQERSARALARWQRCRSLAGRLRRLGLPELAGFLGRLDDWLRDVGRTAGRGQELRTEWASLHSVQAGLPEDDEAAWLLLDLCLQDCLESGAAVRGIDSLYTVWTSSQDVDEGWGAEFAATTSRLVAAFHRYERDEMVQCLRWLRQQLPHCNQTRQASRETMEEALGRLLRRPRRAGPN
jgi:hypothetical protein